MAIVPQMQPEAAFKKRLDRAFDRALKERDPWRTSIEKGQGQKSGLPDRLYCAGKQHIWIESKVGDNKASKLQLAACKRLSLAGMHTAIATYYPASDNIAWSLYQRGEPLPGLSFTPFEMVNTTPFWELLLTGKLQQGLG